MLYFYQFTFTFAICRRLSSVCRLSSVTFMRPTQAIEIVGNVSTPFGTLAIYDFSNPSGRGLDQRGVAKYSDFELFQGYISETVQDTS